MDVCHHTGNGGEHTINIAAPAVPAHVNHGDTVGACAATAGTNSTATTTQTTTTTANTTTTTTGHGQKPKTHGNSGHAGNKAGKRHGGGKGHSK
jgi:hypothetical protein